MSIFPWLIGEWWELMQRTQDLRVKEFVSMPKTLKINVSIFGVSIPSKSLSKNYPNIVWLLYFVVITQRNSCEEVYCESSFKVSILISCVSLGLRKQPFLKYARILDFSWSEYFRILTNGPSPNLNSNVMRIWVN